MPLLRRSRFKRPRFPGEWFVLVDDKGYAIGPYRSASFVDAGDGVWASQEAQNSPTFLRVTEQSGEHLWTQDGTGKDWHYRMVAVDPADPSVVP